MAQTLEFPDDIRPDFHGFSPEAFNFLTGLKKNNDRTWFKDRKDTYDTEIKFAMECLLDEFTPDRRPQGFPVRGDPKRGLFRIYRDVRFSKDKNPYKTHCGGVLTRSGGKGDPGIIYVHIEPGESFLSAGFYSLDKDFLGAWRMRMASDPDGFLDLIEPFTKTRGAYFLRHRGALKTMPRGFQEYADSPVADYIKWKHFLVGRKITDKQAQSRKLVDLIAELADVALPFLSYGWDILETAYEDDPRRHMRTKS
ncbi:MAG: DUF2461 domain-containing protein [Alphaproteobacteria bacterium]